MKNKLVLWGTNPENEKLLIALELHAETSKVMLYIFSEAVANEALVQKVMHEWRDSEGAEALPEGAQIMERELSVTGDILPENIKVNRPEILQRVQTEWHFIVLSAKLYNVYHQELADFKQKVGEMQEFKQEMLTKLSAFWEKVQSQARERNLSRSHADELRDGINELFEQLKAMRRQANAAFEKASRIVYEEYSKRLEALETQIESGSFRFNLLFEELMKVQRECQKARLGNEHRNKLWSRIDAAFKKAKERKFGPEVNAGTVAERHDKRLAGIEEAIKRIEYGLHRDEEELEFQRKKVNASEGQLEAQIRGAKIKMIEERVGGKRERLAELEKARADVQRQASIAHDKEAQRAAKEAERQQIEAKKAAIKSEIEAETHAKAAAAASIAPEVEKETGFFEAASNLIGDALIDALDTAKAVASVAADKAEDAYDTAKAAASVAAEEVLETAKNVANATAEKAEEAYDTAKAVASVAAEKAEEVFETAKAAASVAAEEVLETAKNVANATAEKAEEVYDKAKAAASVAAVEVEKTYDQVVERAEDTLESLKKEDAPADTTIAATDSIIIDDVVHKSAEEDVAALESTDATEGVSTDEEADKKADA
jgi:chromosome segregation ATPase